MPVIVITMSTTIGWMILETAGLSFLGLGSQPPQADLGSMLGEGRKLLMTAPHVATVPGVMIFLVVMSINLVGDGIRDALDPRLRSGALARPAPATAITRDRVPAAPADSGRALLAVTGLRTEFQQGRRIYRAVNGVSFSIAPGECLGLIGESGSGKSVTALSLAALVVSPPGRICAGGVYYRERDLLSGSAATLRRMRGAEIAYVFQDPLTTLHPLYPVGEQIAQAIRAHRPLTQRQAWREAVDLLGRVHIPNPAGRARAYPHELSGGMRQRVGIAMAMANRPSLIVADEPTTALDVTVQAQILGLLDELRREQGVALLFITHDFGVVSQLCDRVAVMYAGRIVEQGPTAELLARPAHPYTVRLIACVPVLGGGRRELRAIPGLPPAGDRLCFRRALPARQRRLPAWDDRRRTDRAGPPSLLPPSVAEGGMTAPILEVRELSKVFGGGRSLLGQRKPGLHAVQGVDLAVHQGETLGVVGESGCGKSTLGRMLVGLTRPSAGTVAIDGRDISAGSSKVALPGGCFRNPAILIPGCCWTAPHGSASAWRLPIRCWRNCPIHWRRRPVVPLHRAACAPTPAAGSSDRR